MNDQQIIEQLAVTNLYRSDADLPDTMRPDVVFLDIARRMDMSMDTKERVSGLTPPQPRRSRALIAVATFSLIIIIGLVAAFLTRTGAVPEPANPPTTQAPALTPPVQEIDVNAADPIQSINDQGSRVTITFAGNAQILAEGTAVHRFEIQLDLEGSNENNPGVSVTYVNEDGVITTTGTSPPGNAVTSTWTWYAEDGVSVLLIGDRIGIPDTRPEIVVYVQETPDSEVIEFVMDTPSG